MDRTGVAASSGSRGAGLAHAHTISAPRCHRLCGTRPLTAHAHTSATEASPDAVSTADSARRSALIAPAVAGLGSWLFNAQPCEAIKEVETPDGRRVQAWEFDVPLRVVALRGSVPAQVQTLRLPARYALQVTPCNESTAAGRGSNG